MSETCLVGEVMGLLEQGWAPNCWGYRSVDKASIILVALIIFIPVCAQCCPVLRAGERLMCLTTIYAADICPTQSRPYVTPYTRFCWGIGIFPCSIVVRATLNMASQWAWRMPFVLQWVCPVPLFLLSYFASELLWHYALIGRYEKANASMRKMQIRQRVDK